MKILFEHHHLYYLPQFLPIIEKFRQQGGHDLFVSINQNVPSNEKTIFYKECQALNLNVIQSGNEKERKHTIKSKNFDIIIAGNKGYLETIAADSSCVVLVYHGIGLKKSYYTDIPPRADILAVESPERLSSLKGLDIYPVVSGFTKLDILAKENNSILAVVKGFQFDNDYPVVLYAPTFYPSSLEKTIPVLATSKLKVNIVVKLHQFSWTKSKYHHHIQLVKSAEQANSMIKLVPESYYNIVPFYSMADVLVTDISSTMFEFLAVNKPVIQTDYYAFRKKHRFFPWLINKRLDLTRFDKVDFTTKIHSPLELEKAINHTLQNPEGLRERRLAAQSEFLYKIDGKAAARLIEGIFNYINK